MECFKECMQNKYLAPLPKYLETPDPSEWANEIKQLRKYLV